MKNYSRPVSNGRLTGPAKHCQLPNVTQKVTLTVTAAELAAAEVAELAASAASAAAVLSAAAVAASVSTDAAVASSAEALPLLVGISKLVEMPVVWGAAFGLGAGVWCG